MTCKTEIQPIFIFSLPRSGSTLLQRMLTTSHDVSTVSEPWVLLPFLYGLKKEGVYAEYSHFCVYDALQDFCKEMPNGEEDYLAAVCSAMLQLYGQVSTDKTKYFLDKTPRYSLIVDKVIKTFPNGKAIFLWRNPNAVIASIVNTFCLGKWKLFHSKVDLFDGMANLVQAYEKNLDQVFSLKYEDLITDTEGSIKKIGRYLDIEYDTSQLDSFVSIKLKGGMGDPTGVVKYSTINTQSLGNWKNTIRNPWRKYWCRRYLEWIGEKRLSLMGYKLEILLSDLESVPIRWNGFLSDLLYSLYGTFYSVFEFKILKDKVRKILKRNIVKKHD